MSTRTFKHAELAQYIGPDQAQTWGAEVLRAGAWLRPDGELLRTGDQVPDPTGLLRRKAPILFSDVSPPIGAAKERD